MGKKRGTRDFYVNFTTPLLMFITIIYVKVTILLTKDPLWCWLRKEMEKYRDGKHYL